MRTNHHRGLYLAAHTERSTQSPLRTARPPAEAVLPLDQHAGIPSRPIVSVGERVLLGQPIAQPGAAPSAWLHASVSGKVVAIEPRPAPQHRGAPSTSIVIANDGRDARYRSEAPPVDFQLLPPAELRELIEQGGIVGLGGAVFPTAAKLELAGRASGPHLLLNGAECEPYISCDFVLMRERANDILLGARILSHAVAATRCTIALETGMAAAESALHAALAQSGDDAIRIVTVPSVYPAGGERQLIASVCGLEVPSGRLPQDIGILCHNVGTAAAIARWLRDREPLISRIVTVTGEAIASPGNLEARLGTPLASLVEECGGYSTNVARLLMGGSMMGVALPHDRLPLTKGVNCIVAAAATDLAPRGVEMPCIRCGECARVCPAILLPQQLHWHAVAGDHESLERLGLMDCIECGCCDYVCPSQIPLTERFRDAKPLVVQRMDARQRADAARANYESREARLVRLDSERSTQLAAMRSAAGKKADD